MTGPALYNIIRTQVGKREDGQPQIVRTVVMEVYGKREASNAVRLYRMKDKLSTYMAVRVD